MAVGARRGGADIDRGGEADRTELPEDMRCCA